jgi:hypothetical protein
VATTETKRVLITVKAYPNPSKTYGETVCCAGIDIDTLQWIRLYPIPFRDLDSSQKFKKYTIISIRCWKAPDDHRIESYKIDMDSIELLSYLDTKGNWESRKKFVLPTVSASFCNILEDTAENKSLGTFKPCDIDFYWKKASLESEAKREACYAQLSFFDTRKEAIEQIPFDFYYQFKCYGRENCPGHILPIIDWEIGQAYRDWRYKYKPQELLLQKIKERWLDRICSEKNDVYFYVGNMKRFHDQFMVLGVFYPKN